ncbi:MAG: NUDIX domain-containing protein [Actinomycetota bacterium]
MSALLDALARADVRTDRERVDVDRLTELGAAGTAAWSRTEPLHVTGSAFVVHPPTRRVLLRWHDRQQAWIQAGGHGDPGEDDPFEVARREAVEETGLDDVAPWPDAVRPRIVHAVVVPVVANDREPAHEHGDLRYVLATEHPERATVEHDGADLRWLTVDEAIELTTVDNVRTTLRRVGELFDPPAPG